MLGTRPGLAACKARAEGTIALAPGTNVPVKGHILGVGAGTLKHGV